VKACLYGQIDGPAVAAIGVWDPLLPAHKDLFAQIRASAREWSLPTVAIAIDPDPVRYLWGPSDVPVYNSAAVRIERIRGCGMDAVLQVRFVKRDIDATAADFFAVVDQYARIAELWLGARQSLGRCEGGSFAAITELAAQRGMQVKRLPFQRLDSRKVRDLLQAGRLAEAARIVGHPPVQSRPASGRLRLAWRPGLYQALPPPNSHPAAAGGELLTLELKKQPRQLPFLDWPDPRIEYLTFVCGPCDDSR
jgi:riboflavin kinase/FMN adenylyltransferase